MQDVTWRFWRWPSIIRELLARSELRLEEIYCLAKRLDMVEAAGRQHHARLEQFVATKMDYNARIRALELRFDRLEELIKKEAATLRLGGDLNAVGEDFMKRFLADGQRYLDEYEDLLQRYSPASR